MHQTVVLEYKKHWDTTVIHLRFSGWGSVPRLWHKTKYVGTTERYHRPPNKVQRRWNERNIKINLEERTASKVQKRWKDEKGNHSSMLSPMSRKRFSLAKCWHVKDMDGQKHQRPLLLTKVFYYYMSSPGLFGLFGLLYVIPRWWPSCGASNVWRRKLPHPSLYCHR